MCPEGEDAVGLSNEGVWVPVVCTWEITELVYRSHEGGGGLTFLSALDEGIQPCAGVLPQIRGRCVCPRNPGSCETVGRYLQATGMLRRMLASMSQWGLGSRKMEQPSSPPDTPYLTARHIPAGI